MPPRRIGGSLGIGRLNADAALVRAESALRDVKAIDMRKLDPERRKLVKDIRINLEGAVQDTKTLLAMQ